MTRRTQFERFKTQDEAERWIEKREYSSDRCDWHYDIWGRCLLRKGHKGQCKIIKKGEIFRFR